MVVRTVGGDGAGFVSGGSSSLSFTDLVRAEVRPSTQLVVFHDTGWRDAPAGVIEEAASAAFKATEEVAPDARVVLILSAADSDTRSALTAAARGAELPVTVVDVTSEDWPASAGQEQFADLLAPYLVDLVRALARSGAFE